MARAIAFVAVIAGVSAKAPLVPATKFYMQTKVRAHRVLMPRTRLPRASLPTNARHKPRPPLAQWGTLDDASASLDAGVLYISTPSGGAVLALPVADGAVRNAITTEAPRDAVVAGGALWVGSATGALTAVEPSSGAVGRVIPFTADTGALTVAPSGVLFAATGRLGAGGLAGGQAAIVSVDVAASPPAAPVVAALFPSAVSSFVLLPGTTLLAAAAPANNSIFLVDYDAGTVKATWPTPPALRGAGRLAFHEPSRTLLATMGLGRLAAIDADTGTLLWDAAADCATAGGLWIDAGTNGTTAFITMGLEPRNGRIAKVTAFTMVNRSHWADAGTVVPAGGGSVLDAASRALYVVVAGTNVTNPFVQVYNVTLD